MLEIVSPPTEMKPTRVVILGGGFAGVYVAKHLTQMLGGRKDVEVELLSDENYFVFQPLLPEVAAGGISATHVVNPIRELIPKARFRNCKIVQIHQHLKILKRRKCIMLQSNC